MWWREEGVGGGRGRRDTLGWKMGGEEEEKKKRMEQACLEIWKIVRDVLPRTMLSSTISTALPANSSSMALSFFFIESFLMDCPGMMNVPPT